MRRPLTVTEAATLQRVAEMLTKPSGPRTSFLIQPEERLLVAAALTAYLAPLPAPVIQPANDPALDEPYMAMDRMATALENMSVSLESVAQHYGPKPNTGPR